MFSADTLNEISIDEVLIKDIRFPTSLEAHGSDAMHTNPDYSCAYVIIKCRGTHHEGHGLTFTIGKGTEIVCAACKSLSQLILKKEISSIIQNFRSFVRSLTCHRQLRWLGPEKGVIHLATAAILNAIWDLFAKIEGKPLWKLLCDMSPERLLSFCDFSYLSDVLTEEEALEMLRKSQKDKRQREVEMIKSGYPVYITSAGWLGYSDEEIELKVKDALSKGFTKFKIKIGVDVENDKRRCAFIRKLIGWDNLLMLDANQIWAVEEAIDWMKELREFKPLWIEEPTAPDDILGYLSIKLELNKYGIGVAGGEHCTNRIMFKQFLSTGAIQFCQIDACRVAGPSEIIPIMLMAKKFDVPVCLHAGGVGLCEYAQHLCIVYYVAISGKIEKSFAEWADHLHEHFIDRPYVINAKYQAPGLPGYSAQMRQSSLIDYEFPHGKIWKFM